MKDLTQPVNTEKTEEEQISETRVPVRGLEGAYGEDEPEYTLDMLISVNPKYEGTIKECCPEARVPVRGLERTSRDNETECIAEREDDEGA